MHNDTTTDLPLASDPSIIDRSSADIDPTTPSDIDGHPTTDGKLEGVLTHLVDDETGAQAMEYAALAGGGITMVSLIGWLLGSDAVQDALESLVTGLVQKLADGLSGLVPFL